MLSTMRKAWMLLALFALVALSSALNIDQALHMDGIEAYLHQGVKRQASTGVSDTPSETSQTPEPSTSDEPSETPSATPTPTTSDEPSSEPPSSTDQPTSNTQAPSSVAPSTSGPNSTPAPTSASSSSRITAPVTRTSALVSTSVQPFTTVFTTVSNGVEIPVTSTGESTFLSTTGTAVTTETPLPQNGDGGGSDSLSDNNKKIIGGVVGGVGGAILLGGIAIVCWRIWGRKKRVSEDDDDLMAGTGSALGDKPQSTSTANTPFQSNLEQYHNPGGRPNAAANF